MPILSAFAKKKKKEYFLEKIHKNKYILEIGCGSGWVSDYLKENGWTNYTGIDIVPPADIVGDIRNWKVKKVAQRMKMHNKLNPRFYWYQGLSSSRCSLIWQDCWLIRSKREAFSVLNSRKPSLVS